MKEEARVQFRGRVERVFDKAVGQWQVVCLLLKVAGGKEGAPDDEFEVNVWQDELKAVARRCQGRQALVVGRVRCKRNANGYLNPTFSAEALLVEPEEVGSRKSDVGGDRREAGVSQHERAKANGFTPEQVHEELAEDDIPF